jgi:hypothetical protein
MPAPALLAGTSVELLHACGFGRDGQKQTRTNHASSDHVLDGSGLKSGGTHLIEGTRSATCNSSPIAAGRCPLM